MSRYPSLEQIFNAVEFSGICNKVVGRDIVMKPSWWVSETKEENFS